MVNKAAVIALAVVVFTSLSVGGLLGMQLATKQGDTADLGGDSTPTQTSTTQQTPQPEQTPVATQTAQPTIEPQSYNETQVALLVHKQINAERKNKNLQTLRFDDDLTEMAVYHSNDMAADNYYAHTSPSGETAKDRFRNFDLYERCKILDNSNSYYHDSAESIGRTTAGTYYTVNGEQRINENEQQIANVIVANWLKSSTDSRYIALKEARAIGVGVNITAEGKVYVTAAYC